MVTVRYLVGENEYYKQTLKAGEKALVPTNPQKSGGTFCGWYITNYSRLAWDFNDPVVFGITLYARFVPTRPVVVSLETIASSLDPSADADEGETKFSNENRKETSDTIKDISALPAINAVVTPIIDAIISDSASAVAGIMHEGATDGTSEDGTTSVEEKVLIVGTNNDAALKTADGPVEVRIDASKEDVTQIADSVANAPEKSTVIIKMKQDCVIEQEILESAKGKDVDLVLDMGSYSWHINGQDITADALQSINMEVKFGADAIPIDKIDKIAEGKKRQTISLTHDGEFGFTATLTLNVGAENAGKYANLYFFNEDDDDLEFIYSDKVKPNGEVGLRFSHASEYVAVIDEIPMAEGNTEGETAGSVWIGSKVFYLVLGVVIIIIALGLTGFVVGRKRSADF